jgi:salicylate hydroxylase
MPKNPQPFLVAGGGIGGLAAAVGLARKGYRSIVLEQAPQLGEIGAGIQIGPNAFHAFDYLGVGDAARAKAVYIDQLILMDATKDEHIASIPLDEPFRKRFRNPYAVVHRADLHMVLLAACEASDLIELRTRSAVERYEQDGSSVTVTLRSGERVTGAALIGADGLRSRVRTQLVGDGNPANARGAALERRHALGRPEMSHRPLPAERRAGLQPRRHLPQRRRRAGRRSAGDEGRGS